MSIASPHEIFVRYTGKEGKSYVNQHRVWDAERFMATRQAEAKNEGGKAKVEHITEQQYRAARK